MAKLAMIHGMISGARAPCSGVYRPGTWLHAAACGLALFALGCGDDDKQERSLDPIVLGMNTEVAPSYESQELTLYEVKLPVSLPIRQPSRLDQEELRKREAPPFEHYPFVLSDQVKVQVTWTISNLDEEEHAVDILIDPWNEFGRYWPGFEEVDDELQPNLSGIEDTILVFGTKSDRPSRRHGTFTFEDMQELAVDFATAINLIGGASPPDENVCALTECVNHVFNTQNRSFEDKLAQPHIPAVIPGLIGFDLGLRTREKANVAIEIVVEVLDKGSGRVLPEDSTDPAMEEPTNFVTAGVAAM